MLICDFCKYQLEDWGAEFYYCELCLVLTIMINSTILERRFHAFFNNNEYCLSYNFYTKECLLYRPFVNFNQIKLTWEPETMTPTKFNKILPIILSFS